MLGPRFVAVRAARDWGKFPSECGICEPREDIAFMMAYVRTEARMQAVESRASKKRAAEAARKADRRRTSRT